MIKKLIIFCQKLRFLKKHNAISKRRKARNDKMRDFYQSSERFRGYVDRYAASDGVTVDVILSRALTREVARYYLDEEPGRTVASTYAPMGECT